MPTTPRSSTSQSSASVTPTPMECGGAQQWPAVLTESPTILKKDQGPKAPVVEVVNQTLVVNKNATIHDFTDSRDVIKADFVKTSPFLQTVKPASATPAHLANTDTTPTSTLTPTMKRIKLKTIGKLMLPTTFLNNDRNNNHTSTNGGGCSGVVSAKETSNTAVAAATLSEQISVESNDSSSQQPPKKIGKIKSPFIENCNQMQQNKVQLNTKCMKFDYRHQIPNSTTTTTTTTALSSVENSNDHHHHNSNNAIGKYFNNSAPILSNGHAAHHGPGHQQEDASTDSGKENIDTSSSNCSENINTSMTKTTTPVGEIRRKFTRKNNNNTQSLNTSSGPTTRTQLTPRSASFNGSCSHTSSPQIDSKYAKYFGMATSSGSSLNSSSGTKMSQENGTTEPPLPKQPPPQMKVSEKSNTTSVEQRLKSSPTASVNATEAFNHHVNNHHWQNHRTSPRGLKRSMTGHVTELKKFEDIVVTERELKLAAKEFDNLLCSESVLQQPPTMVIELEKIFSSIV